MRPKFYIFILFFFSRVLFSQERAGEYPIVDSRILNANDSLPTITDLTDYLNRHFDNDELKCRAIFKWIQLNIAYDISAMYTIDLKGSNVEIVNDALKSRKGVCSAYAAIFDTLCSLNKITSHLIVGTTKTSWLPEPTGHVWNAVKIDGKWYLVDATWGSGYIRSKKFERKLDTHFFLASGRDFYKTHHPMDPIWQLVPDPSTLDQFYNPPKYPVQNDVKWACEDSIAAFFESDRINRLKGQTRRLKENGTNSSFARDYYLYLNNQATAYYYECLNKGSQHYNMASSYFNEYVDYKNKQFNPMRSDDEISKMLPKAEQEIYLGDKLYAEAAGGNNANINQLIEQYVKNNEQIKSRIKEEKTFVKVYLSTGKSKRKSLFYQRIYSAPK